MTSQSETWPGEVTRPGVRTTSMAYDANNRLMNETIDDSTGVIATTYAYDNANNRSSKVATGGTDPGQWSYAYNAANQLTSWQKQLDGSPAKIAALTYDAAGNRINQIMSENGGVPQITNYQWDAQDRLAAVTMPDGSQHEYEYDYRTRRIETRSGSVSSPTATAIVFAGGLSLAEYVSTNNEPLTANSPTVHYVRGPDMGGGVGGMLYSLRGGMTKYSLSNGRGDIVAQADQGASLTWTASYEAYGKRTKETGTNQDKQRANSKDEDPTGLLNEGFRYRDIETGVWLSRDPAGFVDGPNLYAYVKENPWSSFDAHGLYQESGHFYTTYMVGVACGMSKSEAFNTAYYSQLPDEHNDYTAYEGVNPTGSKIIHRDGFLKRVQTSLHCLHGKQEAYEVSTGRHTYSSDICDHRKGVASVVSDKTVSTWERGLAVHALADSYAHTFAQDYHNDYASIKAYSAPIGHGLEGYSPDLVSNRPELYAEYVNHLAKSLSIVTGQKANKEMIDKLLQKAAGLPPGGQDSKNEIKAFRELAQKDFGYDRSYKPENGHEERELGMDSLNREKVGSLMDKLDTATTKKEKKK